jgi:hypothetical protein
MLIMIRPLHKGQFYRDVVECPPGRPLTDRITMNILEALFTRTKTLHALGTSDSLFLCSAYECSGPPVAGPYKEIHLIITILFRTMGVVT